MSLFVHEKVASFQKLKDEGIPIYSATFAPPHALHILILNLMPKKIEAECQYLRLLGSAHTPVIVDFARITSRPSRFVSNDYLRTTYLTYDDICHHTYDGFIITGTPVEHLNYEEVDFWQEVTSFLNWTTHHVRSSLHYCWGALAAMYHHYGIGKTELDKKLFGIYPYRITTPHHPLLTSFDATYHIPQARFYGIEEKEVEAHPFLEILGTNDHKGIDICASKNSLHHIFVFGHFEYDRDSMINEYYRDKEKGRIFQVPENYFPHDNIQQTPLFTWNKDAKQFHKNWLTALSSVS